MADELVQSISAASLSQSQDGLETMSVDSAGPNSKSSYNSSATRHSVISSNSKKFTAPVILHIYDLIHPEKRDAIQNANWYLYGMGLGLYHSGVEIYDYEYAYGGHYDDDTGVFHTLPKQAPEVKYRESCHVGDTDMSPDQVHELIQQMCREYPGNGYSLLSRNCNHFADDLCFRLTGKHAPGWINRAAYYGSFFKSWLPEGVDQPQNAVNVPANMPVLPSKK